jgi:hypothetical protein
MKRFAPIVALSIFFFLNLFVHAQSSQPADDSSAIRATVTNYSEAYFTGDARRMEKTLHPHYLKHMIHGDIPVREKTGTQMVEEVRKNGPAVLTAAQKTEQVIVLDVAGVIASAKLITPGWTDYMTLSKVDGQWKILSVVQRIDD